MCIPILRPKSFVGPERLGVFALFYDWAESGKNFPILGNGRNRYQLLDVEDLCNAIYLAATGNREKVNDTFNIQLVADAKAAIDKADEMGVIDRKRVGVGAHSYGAFMTANLLANCDLFRAGIARSGAYNRTLTPFGFQAEERTLWEAPDVYARMSPFTHAHPVKTPILLPGISCDR